MNRKKDCSDCGVKLPNHHTECPTKESMTPKPRGKRKEAVKVPPLTDKMIRDVIGEMKKDQRKGRGKA